jgi:dihydroxy-acid dehydratase
MEVNTFAGKSETFRKFLMEDFYYAGGLPVVINELKKFLHTETITVNGKSVDENY